jgi:outer membrane lipoprotein-sorting protein
MLKKLLKYFSFSVVVLIVACAPKVAPPPAVYQQQDISLQEILDRAGADIEVMKAIAEVKIEKSGEDYNFVKTSVLIKKPDWIHMRLYQLGMLVKDFVIKGDTLHVLTGKRDENLKKLGQELHYAIFWWDHFADGYIYTGQKEYLITREGQTIYLDKKTLLPVRQELYAHGTRVFIEYSKPVEYEGYWYPSFIEMYAGEFKFIVNLKKIIKNPALQEFDFRTASTTGT